MSYSDIKITQADINNNNVRSASDILIGNADDNKAVFDKLPEFIAGKHNDLVDALDEVSEHAQGDTEAIDKLSEEKVNAPKNGAEPDFGEAGQMLTTKGNGQTQWEDAGRPTDEQTQNAINNWLDVHPEATTTVQDEAITRNKLAQNLSDFLPLEYNKAKFEKDGGSTTVWYSIIPSDYKPKLCLANDSVNTVETATENANRNHATIAINAGVFYTATGVTKGYLINDGVTLNETNYDDGQSQEYLYADSNGTLNSTGSSANLTLAELQALNPRWALLGFYAIAKNGEFVAADRADDYYNAPRTFVGQDASGNYIVGVSGGRNDGEKGLSMIDIYNFCLNVARFTPYFLYNLDGGESSALVYNGTRVNPLTQGENRECANFLIWAKDNTRIENAFETTNPIADKLISIEQYLYKNVDLMAKVPAKINSLSSAGYSDCNDVTYTSIFLCGSTTTNFPINDYGFLITLRHNGFLVNQIALNKSHVYIRELYLGSTPLTPSKWREVYSSPSYTTVTSGTHVSANYMQYAKSGNVVIVNCDIQITATISTNSVLATGLPKGLISEQNGVIFKLGNVYRVKVTDNGDLMNLDELPSGYYKISLTYFSE